MLFKKKKNFSVDSRDVSFGFLPVVQLVLKFGTILYEENPKSELQEAIQADTKETVVYKLLKEE